MRRLLAPILIAAALTAPAAADDEFLKEMFNGDGGSVDIGETGTPSDPACGGAYDSELPESDACSGWVVAGYADYKDGNGPEPVYWNLQLGPVPPEATDEDFADEPEPTPEETQALIDAYASGDFIDMSFGADGDED